MATLLTCREISKAFGLRELFDGLSIGFADGERTGLIGPNGAGKSTLLRILAGLEQPDSGAVQPRRAARIGYVPQEDSFPDGTTAGDVLLAAVGEPGVPEHERTTRVNITLSRFGFEAAQAPVASLSGGWRKRLALAREIIREPDLLLMDEPTNHLDLEGIAWLEEYLARAPFAFVAVSHDRYFLERVTARVVELNAAYPDGYFSVDGSYSTFLDKRADLLAAQRAQQDTLANIVRRESAFLKSQAKARRTKAKSRIDDAHRLQDELRELKQRNAQGAVAGIEFDGTGRQTRKLLEASGLSKSLGGRVLFRDVSLLLSPGTRLGLLGSNGSGKTTLIRLLSGDLEPDDGTIRRADDLRVVLFDQKRDQLPQDVPLRQALAGSTDTVQFRGRPMHVSGWARRFLFRDQQLDVPVRELSGGEQARILIARLMLQPAEILILDEPTNDLDIASLDVLEESLASFPGAIVLVTHDRFMLDRLCTEVIGLDGDGHAAGYANREQWQAARAQRREVSASGSEKPATRPKSTGRGPQRTGLTSKEKKELKAMEDTIQQAEEQVDRLRAALNSEEVAADHVEMEKRWRELETARKHTEDLYARWEELEAKAGSDG